MDIITKLMTSHNKEIKKLVNYAYEKLQIKTIFKLSFFKKPACYSDKNKLAIYYISVFDLCNPYFYKKEYEKIFFSLSHEYGHGTNFQDFTNHNDLRVFNLVSSVISSYNHQNFGLSLIKKLSNNDKHVTEIRKVYSLILREEHRAWSNSRIILSLLDIKYSNDNFVNYRKKCLMSYRKLSNNRVFTTYFAKSKCMIKNNKELNENSNSSSTY